MSFELFDRAAGATMCDILAVAGPTLVGAGIYSVGTGFATPLAIGAMGVGAASMLAENYLCEPMDLGGVEPIPGVGGCQKVDGYGQLEYNDGSGWKPAGQTGSQTITANAVSIVGVGLWGPGANGERYSECEFSTVSYGTVKVQAGDTTLATAQKIKWRINPTNGSCSEEPSGDLPPEVYTPRPYTDSETNCNYTVTFQGFFEEIPGGEVRPVLLIESANDVRTDYGRMGGCNLNPTIYVPGPGGGGGGTSIPGPPGPPGLPGPPNPDDVPWWWGPLLGGATGAGLKLIGDALAELLGPKLPAGSFTLTAPCDQDEAGIPLTQTWTYPAQKAQERMIAHQITQLEALQTHLNWKTPICGNEKPPLQGEWVTTRWESVEVMPHSGHRLRKQFRYRSKSGLPIQERSAYWEWFQWRSGDFIVRHEGAWWGNPQVWAESEEEGKRVIRFAAGEAGLDPDKIGEWKVSRSSAPRYGMSGTMRIQLYKGFPWISSRGGASYPNTLAKVHDP